MSIQTELTRITNAKTAIKTAIEGKGVTVPDGTMLDGMAALIQAISAGGGKSFFEKVTLSAKTKTHTINHNLGECPNYAFYITLSIFNSLPTNTTVACICVLLGSTQYEITIGTGSTSYNSKGYAKSYVYTLDNSSGELGMLSDTALMTIQKANTKLVTIGASSYYIPAGTFLFGCGVADFGDIT